MSIANDQVRSMACAAIDVNLPGRVHAGWMRQKHTTTMPKAAFSETENRESTRRSASERFRRGDGVRGSSCGNVRCVGALTGSGTSGEWHRVPGRRCKITGALQRAEGREGLGSSELPKNLPCRKLRLCGGLRGGSGRGPLVLPCKLELRFAGNYTRSAGKHFGRHREHTRFRLRTARQRLATEISRTYRETIQEQKRTTCITTITAVPQESAIYIQHRLILNNQLKRWLFSISLADVALYAGEYYPTTLGTVRAGFGVIEKVLQQLRPQRCSPFSLGNSITFTSWSIWRRQQNRTSEMSPSMPARGSLAWFYRPCAECRFRRLLASIDHMFGGICKMENRMERG